MWILIKKKNMAKTQENENHPQFEGQSLPTENLTPQRYLSETRGYTKLQQNKKY